METGFIYKITSPTGRVYIGSTNNFVKRMRNYEGMYGVNQRKIYNSIKKYGWDAHTVEIIEEPLLENMLAREAYWGAYYDVLGKNGLNLMLPKIDTTYKTISDETRKKFSDANKGSNNNMYGRKHSKETKEKISRANSGRKPNDEVRLKMSISRKRRGKFSEETVMKISKAVSGEKNGMYGKKHTEEARLKMSESRKGRKLSEKHKQILLELSMGRKHSENTKIKMSENNTRKVLVLNMETGVYYDSMKEASLSCNLSISSINHMLNPNHPLKNKTQFKKV